MHGTTTVQRVRRVAPFVLPIVSLAFALACTRPGPGPGTTRTTVPTRPPTTTSPPDINVSAGNQKLALRPFTFCWINLCADGVPPADPPGIGPAGEVALGFAVDGWTFSATLKADAASAPVEATVTATGRQTHRIVPNAPPGTYYVYLFGRGPGGDVAAAFHWTVS